MHIPQWLRHPLHTIEASSGISSVSHGRHLQGKEVEFSVQGSENRILEVQRIQTQILPNGGTEYFSGNSPLT